MSSVVTVIEIGIKTAVWSSNYRDLEVQLYPKNRLFWKNIFWPLGGAAHQNFHRRYRMSKPY